MLRDRNTVLIVCLMLALPGCQIGPVKWVRINRPGPQDRQRAVAAQPTRDEILRRVKSHSKRQYASAGPLDRKPEVVATDASPADSVAVQNESSIRTAADDIQPADAEVVTPTLTDEEQADFVDGTLVELESPIIPASAADEPVLLPLPEEDLEQVGTTPPPPPAQDGASYEAGQQYPLDLPRALGLVGGQHPVVGFAQWRVQEAYAQLDQAEVLWLPSLQAGFSYYRHDGNLQNSDGKIIDVNRNSFQYGLGAGAVGAGTTQRPGVVAQFHVADAIFQPEIAQKNAWARGHAASAVYNKQLLDAALAYLNLLAAEQGRQILAESRQRTAELSKLTSDFAITGQGLQSDADRMATELDLVQSRLAEAAEQADIASSRLAQTLSISPRQRIVPVDPMLVPIELVADDYDAGMLITTGLSHRPELKEAQNLVAAACDEYKRQKYAPLIPSVLLGFSTDGFGGGQGGGPNNFGERYDFDALMLWEVRNLGFGEKAARRETLARVEQAKYEKVRLLDQVAADITEAHAQVVHRRQRIEITERAIRSALDSYNRNLNRIRDNQGLPIEVLQSVKALEDAQRAYAKAVAEYNQAQFRLQWALGWQVVAPAPADQQTGISPNSNEDVVSIENLEASFPPAAPAE